MTQESYDIKPGEWDRITPDRLFPQIIVASFWTLHPGWRTPDFAKTLKCMKIMLVTHGELTVSSSGLPPRTVNRGDLCVVFPGYTYSCVTGGTSTSVYQAIFYSAPPPLHQAVPFLPGHGFMPDLLHTDASLETVVALFEAIISALISVPANFRSLTTEKLMTLINMIFALVTERDDAPRVNLSKWGHIVGELETAAVPPDIRELAGRMHMSTDHFIRGFKEYTGLTPKNYYQRKRLCDAQQMLLGGKSVKETAFACGFACPSYFSRLFKKYFEITPSACRTPSKKVARHHAAVPISRNFFAPGMDASKFRRVGDELEGASSSLALMKHCNAAKED